jgi:hypothetical protein
MMISFNKIVLRDQIKNDIDDEIRWMTEETGWIKADTPWEPVIQIDPEQLKKQMMQNISRLNPGSVRNRLEITVDDRHIGFVSVYPFEVSAVQHADQNTLENKAVGIENMRTCFQKPWLWNRRPACLDSLLFGTISFGHLSGNMVREYRNDKMCRKVRIYAI